MSTKRLYCRHCSDLAGYSHDVCQSCFAAEVSFCLRERGRARPGDRNPPEMQLAYARAIDREQRRARGQ